MSTKPGQLHRYVRSLRVEKPPIRVRETFRNITDFEQHVRLYTQPDMLPVTEFLISSPQVSRPDTVGLPSSTTVQQELEICLRRLQDKGLKVIVVDLTTPDIAEVGLCVVRVLIPGMQPLSGDHRIRYLGGTRSYEMPHLLGYSDRNSTEAEINPYPHPFP